jgi:hypothetical protein
MARNPDALTMITDDGLEAIWIAMVSNAANPGSTGATDRQSLFKAAGLPFTMAAVAGKAGGGGPANGIAVRDRLEKGLGRSRRRAPVTQDEPAEETAMETAA